MKTALYFAFKAFGRHSPQTNPSKSFCKGMQGLLQGRAVRRGTAILVNAANDAGDVGCISALNEAIAADQEWVRIAPFRAIPNEVGLQVFDRTGADAMVQAFNSVAGKVSRMFRGLPVYVGHPDEESWAKKNPGSRAEAVGRIKALEVRDDGLFGQVAFNDEGKRLVSGEAAAYAFHSPRWGMRPITHEGRKAFRPVLLHSIGLTNNPNIPDNAIGLNEAPSTEISPSMKTNIIALLAALGRPVSNPSAVTDEQLAAAINEAAPVAITLVTGSNELTTVKPQLATALNEVTALKTKLTTAETNAVNERAARVTTVLTTAINSGKITEAQRAEWSGKLTSATDFAAVEIELGKLTPAINTKGRVGGLGNRKSEVTASEDQIMAINTAVSKHIKESGLDPVKDYNRAFTEVQKAQPALFTAAA